MKNIKPISEQVEIIIKEHKPLDKKNQENLEFIDINKTIEKMLTANSTENNKKIDNVFAL
jgi:hypothetical protein